MSNVIPLVAGAPIPCGVRETSPPEAAIEPMEEKIAAVTSITPDTDVASLRDEMLRMVADIEFRLAQQYELRARSAGLPPERIYAEDMATTRHALTGYTLSSNSPTAGSIAWTSLHVVYLGVDYVCANGSTPNRYVWFVKPASGTAVTLNTGNAVPSLGPDDQLLFVNDGGVARVADSAVSYAVADNTVGNSQLMDGAVTSDKTDFYATLNTAITNAQNAADIAQSTADGSITTYFQAAAPWANGDASAGGASNPAAKVGDVWYDSDDGQAYRWSGAAGSPANQWIPITDSDITTALANANAAQNTANKKIQTFYAPSTSVPTAETGGDMWIVTDQNNKLKRATAVGTGGWVDVLLGDAAISGVGGGKVGTGINANNVTTGTLNGTLVGTGINGSNVTSGTVAGVRIGSGVAPSVLTGAGTMPVAGLPTVPTSKINTATHLLY